MELRGKRTDRAAALSRAMTVADSPPGAVGDALETAAGAGAFTSQTGLPSKVAQEKNSDDDAFFGGVSLGNDFSDTDDDGDKDAAAAAAAAFTSAPKKRNRSDTHKLRYRRDRRAKTDALRQMAAEGEASEDDWRPAKQNKRSPAYDAPVEALFVKLVEQLRVLNTGIFSDGRLGHYLLCGGAYVPFAKANLVAIYQKEFDVTCSLADLPRLDKAIKTYVRFKLDQLTTPTDDSVLVSMRNLARRAIAFRDGSCLKFDEHGNCSYRDTMQSDMLFFEDELADALPPAQLRELLAFINDKVDPPAMGELSKLIRAVICDDGITEQWLTLEARSLADFPDAAKWSVVACGVQRRVGKSLLLMLFSKAVGPSLARKVETYHRTAFTGDGGGGSQVARAASAAYGRARKLLVDEVGQGQVRVDWDAVKLWQDELQPVNAPWAKSDGTGQPYVRRAARVDFTSNADDPHAVFKRELAPEDKRGVLCLKLSDTSDSDERKKERINAAEELSKWMAGERGRSVEEARMAAIALVVKYTKGRVPNRCEPHEWNTLDKLEMHTAQVRLRVWLDANASRFRRGGTDDKLYPRDVLKASTIEVGVGSQALKKPYAALAEFLRERCELLGSFEERRDTNNTVYYCGLRMEASEATLT